jgi:hypothetical protein
MIRIYCRARHNRADALCTECRELRAYVEKRLAACPFQQDKTSCAKCSVHCYNPTMREQIKKVMRFSGPKMILHHPYLAVAHLLDERRKPAKACNFSGSEKPDSEANRV